MIVVTALIIWDKRYIMDIFEIDLSAAMVSLDDIRTIAASATLNQRLPTSRVRGGYGADSKGSKRIPSVASD